MSRSIITLTTDFGTDSPYVAQMKGAILAINPQATIVDVTHAIVPHDIAGGALVLEHSCRYFPDGAIHVAVVDPGVGTARALLYAGVGSHHFLAPDNGLLTRVADQENPACLIRLEDRSYWRPSVSATFHGRDILAPAAAHLSLGLEPDRLGPRQQTMVRLDVTRPARIDDRIIGCIADMDSFGNLITSIEAELIPEPLRAACRIVCRQRRIEGLVRTYGDRPAGTAVALIGSHGRLEIAVVRGHAALELSAHVGDEVIVQLAAPGRS